MSPRSIQDLLEHLSLGNYFTFTVVRHPFDRLVSAFRDRILKGCTAQAKYHIPQIFHMTRKQLLYLGTSVLFDDTSGCIKSSFLPTFQEFIQYIVQHPDTYDNLHWITYDKHCSPCLVEYDAIIKLETAQQDEEYVLSQSDMNQYLNLEYKHFKTNGNGTNDHLRADYFANITCHQLDQLEQAYHMDLQLFEYDTEPFRKYCISRA